MDLPSSPPQLPFTNSLGQPADLSLDDVADELPTSSSAAFALALRPPSAAGRSRKRQLSDYGSLSSDPLFSEEPSEADAADYERPPLRRKRWVRGPWWQQQQQQKQRRTSSSRSDLRRGLARRGEKMRPADSGVLMGSDATESDFDGIHEGFGSSHEDRLGLEDHDEADETEEEDGDDTIHGASVDLPSQNEGLARAAINACLETGREYVDLSDLDLSTLSNDLLSSLHQLIRWPANRAAEAPSEEEFKPLTPSIQLYLSGNKLSALPPELFRLTNITVLSLRNNKLDHIPSAIGRMSNLQELNLAQNQLRHLPWELFDLVQSNGSERRITLRPNPFVEPAVITGPYPLPRPNATPSELIDALSKWGEIDGAFHKKMQSWYRQEGVPWGAREELEIRLKLGRTRRTNYVQEASRAGNEVNLSKEPLIFLAPSTIRYFDVDGSLLRTTHSGTTAGDEADFSADLGNPCAPPSQAHAVPSLFELSLRSMQKIYSPIALQHPPSSLPARVRTGLRTAGHSAEWENPKCTTCGKAYVLARAEWMEYWFNGFPSQEGLSAETVLPFLRRACSWLCAVPTALGGFRF